MPVQEELIIEIGQTQANLKTTVTLMNDVDKAVKKTSTDSKTSFASVSTNIQNTNTKLNQSIGLLTQLRTRIEDLRKARAIAGTTEEVSKLTEEIRKTELQVAQLEGRMDAFGNRQRRGLADLTGSFFTVGQGIIGVTNLIGILGDKGEKENEALIAATRLLVIAESARSVVVGFLKAQELAALLVSRLQTTQKLQEVAVNKAVTTSVDEQAIAYAVLAGAKRSDLVATEAGVAGNVALAGATDKATTSTKGLNLALLANPYVLIAAGILAVVGAMILFSDESDKITAKMIEDMERQLELQNSLAASRAKALEAELNFLRQTGQLRGSQAQRITEEQNFANELERIEKEKNLALLKEQKAFQDKSKSLRAQGILDALTPNLVPIADTPIIGVTESEQKRHNERIAQLTLDFNTRIESLKKAHDFTMLAIDGASKKEEIEEDNKLANLKISLIRNDLDRAIKERQQKAREETAALLPEETNRAEKIRLINEKSARDIQAIREKAARDAVDTIARQLEAERQLHQRVLDAQADLGTNREKLLADQFKARENLQVEFGKITLAREREIIDEAKKIGLEASDPEVLRQIQEARRKIAAEFQKIFEAQQIAFGVALNRLEANDAKARLAIVQDSLEKRLALFDIEALAEKEAIIKAGGEITEIERALVERRLKLIRDFYLEKIDFETKSQKDILERTIDTEKLSAAAIEKIRLEQLEMERRAASEKLALVLIIAQATNDSTQATANVINDLKNLIKQIDGQITTAKKNISPINWADIFGIPADFKDEFNAAVGDLFTTGQQIWTQAIQAEIEANEALIQSNQDVIDSLNTRIDETEAALREEEELFRRGFASNVDLKRRELAALKAEREKELADQKKLQAERIKLAREQQAIESIAQAANIVTAGSNLIKTWSTLPFGVGLALAFAQVATIISFIGSLKTRASQLSSQGFQKGGYTGDGPVHEVAGPAHRREFYFNEKKTTEFRDIFEKIHRDQPLNSMDLSKLLKGTGVVLPEEEKKNILANNVTIRGHEEQSRNDTIAVMARKFDALTQEVRDVKDTLKNRPVTYNEPDGATVIIRGNEKKTIRKAQ